MIKELFPNLINFKIKKIKYIKNTSKKTNLILYIKTSLDKCFIKNVLEFFFKTTIDSINIKNNPFYKIIYIKY